MRLAGLGFIQRLEWEGFLPHRRRKAWKGPAVVAAAAASPRDSSAKLR